MARFEEKFNITSALEAAVGALTGVLFLYVLGTDRTLSPMMGVGVTLLWISIWYVGIAKLSWKPSVLKHLMGCYAATLIISVIFGLFFGVIAFKDIFSISFLGSTPIVVSLIGVITAIVFDYTDRMSVLNRYLYYSGYSEQYNDNSNVEKVTKFCKEKFKNKGELSSCIRELS